RDIAEKAVEALRDAHWSGFRIMGVHGPEDLDHSRAAQIISEGIGRPVKYVEVTVDQAKQGMLEAGMPGFIVDLMGDMYTGFRAGRIVPAEPRSAETTTRTSLLEFSREVLKPAVEAALKH
ncbi:MAG: NmrA family transcriptional regulator, partial [Pyrinomonadaceae bacterium]